MTDERKRAVIAADDMGIHFLRTPGDDIVVTWDELDAIIVGRLRENNGFEYLEFYVHHISGVDFRFHNVEPGYSEVMQELERRLPGFSRAAAESVGEDEITLWERNSDQQ
jgi:hypothetical protein